MATNNIPNFPAFDMLVGRTNPYQGFGAVENSNELESKQRSDASVVRERIRKAFRVKLESPVSSAQELDRLIEKMWGTGWDPSINNLNLFTHEFGLLLLVATLDLFGGRANFRSSNPDVYVHNSISWPGVEAFPFHKAFKCMTERDGESMAHFVRGVAEMLEEKGALSPSRLAEIPGPTQR